MAEIIVPSLQQHDPESIRRMAGPPFKSFKSLRLGGLCGCPAPVSNVLQEQPLSPELYVFRQRGQRVPVDLRALTALF